MKIVEFYILRRMVSVFLSALIAALAIVWTTQALHRIDLVTDSGQSMTAFMFLATMLLPAVVPIVVPFAVVIGIALTLSTMNTDSELPVINAAGASRWAFCRPALILGAAASVVTFAFDNGVEPYARQSVRSLITEARADLFSTVIQEGTFRRIDEGLYVQVGERRQDGRLGNIFVADSRDPDVSLIYYAADGDVVRNESGTILAMQNGEVHRKEPGGDVSVIRFNSYAFDLSAFAPVSKKPFLFPKDQTLGYLLNPDPNDRLFKTRPQYLRAELHNRFSQWFYPFVFALIALAAAGDARSHREGGVHPLITALATALVIRWLGFFVIGKAELSSFFNPLIYAVPTLTGAGAAWLILSNRRMDVPVSWSDRISDWAERLREFMIATRIRMSGFKRRQSQGNP